jgi:arginine repressor
MPRTSAAKSAETSQSKSAAIRDMISQNPRAKAKEIVRLLAEKGVNVRPTLVYYIRSRDKHHRRRQKRQQVVETTKKTISADPVKFILKVRELAGEAGGMKQLKQLVDVLAQ